MDSRMSQIRGGSLLKKFVRQFHYLPLGKYAVTPVGVGGCVPAPSGTVSGVQLPGVGNGAIDPKGAVPAGRELGVRESRIHPLVCGRLPSGCVRESRVTCRHFAQAARGALLAKLAAQRHARRA